jgi:hypothetical protein
MALAFPPSPTLNQTYTNNGRTYVWNGVTWSATVIPTNKKSPVYVSASPPPNVIQGDLWYSTINSNLNIYYVDMNGGQWVSVVPYPDNSINQNGGIFDGPIYGTYEIPNTPTAFVTVGYFNQQLTAYLSSGGYMRSGNGTEINNVGEITLIDSGLLS